MNWTHVLNALGLVSCLALSAVATMHQTQRVQGLPSEARRGAPGKDGAHARPALQDPDGTPVASKAYQRIVSLNPVADHLLLRLVEPTRLLAISTTSANGHPEHWRFGDVGSVNRDDSVETVLSIRPDLVVTSPYVDGDKIARLREAGITCFNPGEMRGIASACLSIERLGRLLDAPERARTLTSALDRDVRALRESSHDSKAAGIYLSIYGDTFFGGTAGTSYGDVLELAGIRDIAAAAGFTDWPQYTAEQLVVLDPPLIVTRRGMKAALLRHPALAGLQAVNTQGAILETNPAYDGDAGLGVIHAAAALQQDLQKPSRSAK